MNLDQFTLCVVLVVVGISGPSCLVGLLWSQVILMRRDVVRLSARVQWLENKARVDAGSST